MSASKYALSQVAEAWEKDRKKSEKVLEEWVQENPQWWVIGVATLTKTSMDLGAGLVDVLRFGEGAAEGGAMGVGKDALRLIGLMGPIGKGAAWAQAQFVNLGALRLAVAVNGVNGPCTFQAVNNAMSIVKGKSLFVTVKDMARAMGRTVRSLRRDADGLYDLGAWVDDLVPIMRASGATVRELAGLTRMEQVVQQAARNRVIICAFKTTIRTLNKGKMEEEPILHSVIVVKDALGRVRFADYGGKFFRSIEELCAHHWGNVIKPVELLQKGMSGAALDRVNTLGPLASTIMRGTALLIEGVTAIATVEDGVEFAVPAELVAVPASGPENAVPAEVMTGSIEAFKERKAGKKVIRLPEMVIKAGAPKAPSPESLKGVQFRLNALGFGAGPVDGVMGPRTARAVRSFQNTYPPLSVDAVPGPKTQAKLVEVCGY